MTISVFDLFKIGIGPSSSHTVGPMRAAGRFIALLTDRGLLDETRHLRAHLYGSLAATGEGHGTIGAVTLGLAGAAPDTVDPDGIPSVLAEIAARREVSIGGRGIGFSPADDIVLHAEESLPGHPNGLELEAFGSDGQLLVRHRYYSVGGGFVVDEGELAAPLEPDAAPVPHPYRNADELLAECRRTGLSISQLQLANEAALRPAADVRARLLQIWRAMQDCVTRGCHGDGVLPGGLGVNRRAGVMYRALTSRGTSPDPLAAMDWVNLYALAVNEENAAGGRVVTAPTNGAAGIVPAVLHYYADFVPGAGDDEVVRFLLAAAAIGTLFKLNASISGAEVGCQGEVGSACAMAAAGLAEVLGGTPEQVENAAEIALEHNLGLTCDPIGGLVQVPCIERNAMASTQAVNAARLALHGDGTHLVSLDQAIATMRDTGRDMHEKYKETARGGLAVTFRSLAPVPVSVIEC